MSWLVACTKQKQGKMVKKKNYLIFWILIAFPKRRPKQARHLEFNLRGGHPQQVAQDFSAKTLPKEMYILCILSQLVTFRSIHPVIGNRMDGITSVSPARILANINIKEWTQWKEEIEKKKKKKEGKETKRQTEVTNYEVGSCFTRLIGTTFLISINTWWIIGQ